MTKRKKNRAAVALGRLGGLATSAKKTKAVRANGKLGGRPKKTTQERIDYFTQPAEATWVSKDKGKTWTKLVPAKEEKS